MTSEASDNEHTGAPSEDRSIPAESEPQPNNRGPISGGFGILIFVVLFGAAGFLTYRTIAERSGRVKEPTPDPPPVTYMCAETKKTFLHVPKMGENVPVMSPHTDRKTGYPVERCYWTKDGKPKASPTFVILNEHLGIEAPTICPDCGRTVYHGNPSPVPESALSEPDADTASDASTSTD